VILQTVGLALIASAWLYLLYQVYTKNRKLHRYFFYLYIPGVFLQIVAGGFGTGLSFPAALNLIILLAVFFYFNKIKQDI
jgi:hypothetical protein